MQARLEPCRQPCRLSGRREAELRLSCGPMNEGPLHYNRDSLHERSNVAERDQAPRMTRTSTKCMNFRTTLRLNITAYRLGELTLRTRPPSKLASLPLRRSNQTVLLRTSFENVWKIWRCRHVCSSTAIALFLRSGLAPATMNMQSAPTERKSESQEEGSVSTVAHLSVHERSSCDCDSRARHDVGTHRLNGRGLATARQLAHIIQRCK